ncbi:MAG: glycoside hydrolase family 3 C-terminal domain-containing protein, partial [Bacteroidales bacterium]|nr:glycoside hydrolase family 3 C-terminal domain-containing protein [Bacteroidales bacterium]
DDAVIAEPKHYGVHSIPEAGKNTAPVYIGEREARSNFLYVFEKAFVEAEALGAMAAYHEWDGIPAAADPWLLNDLLRGEWGFKGMVLSDLGAIAKQTNSHGTAETPKEAIANSIRAGLDMQFYDYKHDVFQKAIIDAVNDKTLTMDDVDRAVASVLYVKFRLGLFEKPYTNESLKAERYHSKEHQEIALESARKSITLLHNKNDILPLGDKVKKIALIGEMAGKVHLGGYSPKNVEGVSIADAFKDTNYDVEFVDLNIPAFNLEQISDKFLMTESGERGLLAEYFNNTECSGNPVFSQVETSLVKYWHNLSPEAGVNSDNFSIRWTGYITPEISGIYNFGMIADDIARLTIDGEVIIDNWDRSTINQWAHHKMRLEKGKKYAVKLEFAEFEDYAGLQLKWEIKPDIDKKSTMFEKAVIAAKKADVAILVLGETEDDSGEGKDKLRLELNDNSKRLLNEVATTGTPIILVLQNGRPLAITEELEKLEAVLETWYAGELSGQATVEILTGKVNPSGKLPITVPKTTGQVPLYYNQKKSATASYVDGTREPLFAFGHGLSYSEFAYADLDIQKQSIGTNEEQLIKAKVKNTSEVAGTEIVQLYITDVFSSVATPAIQLRGFKRVELQPGEEKEVTFTLLPDDLALWNKEMKRVVEPGEFKVMVGAASDDLRLESVFRVIE